MKAEQFCVKKTVLVTLKSAWDVILANVKFLCFVCSSRDYCVFRQPVFFFLSSFFFFFFFPFFFFFFFFFLNQTSTSICLPRRYGRQNMRFDLFYVPSCGQFCTTRTYVNFLEIDSYFSPMRCR